MTSDTRLSILVASVSPTAYYRQIDPAIRPDRLLTAILRRCERLGDDVVAVVFGHMSDKTMGQFRLAVGARTRSPVALKTVVPSGIPLHVVCSHQCCLAIDLVFASLI